MNLIQWEEMVSKSRLERKMQVAQDTKKEFVYAKDTGEWHWYNRGDASTMNVGFPTFLAALDDAVEPYEI